MRKFYFTPGPSQLYYTVEEHMKNALKENVLSISHRSKDYEKIHQQTIEAIRSLLVLPNDYHIFFTSSATEIWERIIQNTVEAESFHLINGAFSRRFLEIAENYQINAMSQVAEEGKVVEAEELLIPETAELIAVTQNETSTGASQPIDDIKKIRKAFPDQLIALDVVSSAPYANVDYSMVDTAYFSVQKCFGLPAGLGVWIVNNRCFQKAQSLMNKNRTIGSYHSLPSLLEKGIKNQTPETPNVLGVYLLGKVATDMANKGIDQIRRETEYKAAVLYQAFEQSEILQPFVTSEVHRSKTTLVANTAIPSKEIISKLSEKSFVIGNGYGKFKDKHIRIANFPTHSKEHIEILADELLKIKN
ncbi:aminotransferase class V-fold PLP-dependent enzyme [Fulvivirga ulvae]|uniref:aminotransferase class V-fold PLP-dependent enzyme n=1 Tax=Fulvivirga ulvae TaxID=2904245 RepID=UPI001F488C5A|nr:aminotransferase class V-fold PLP-dependent enzyme [Fulvivirga ulvae]UII30932.1 aminotransferase class V-fold PLP-dependent enzyme [Fulvivirga ulvae]